MLSLKRQFVLIAIVISCATCSPLTAIDDNSKLDGLNCDFVESNCEYEPDLATKWVRSPIGLQLMADNGRLRSPTLESTDGVFCFSLVYKNGQHSRLWLRQFTSDGQRLSSMKSESSDADNDQNWSTLKLTFGQNGEKSSANYIELDSSSKVYKNHSNHFTIKSISAESGDCEDLEEESAKVTSTVAPPTPKVDEEDRTIEDDVVNTDQTTASDLETTPVTTDATITTTIDDMTEKSAQKDDKDDDDDHNWIWILIVGMIIAMALIGFGAHQYFKNYRVSPATVTSSTNLADGVQHNHDPNEPCDCIHHMQMRHQ